VILLLVATGLLLLLANGLFVAAEFGFVAAQRSRMQRLAAGGNQRAITALAVMASLPTTLAATQLGITVASIGLGMTAEAVVSGTVEPAFELLQHWLPAGLLAGLSIAVSLGLVTFLHTMLGEMVPKNLAITEPERTALWLSGPMRRIVLLTEPAVKVLAGAADLLLRAFRIEPKQGISGARTAEDIATAVRTSQVAGAIKQHDAQLASRVLTFADRHAGSIMLPRSRMEAVPETARAGEVEQVAAQTGHLTIPVYRDTLDHAIGFLRIHDLLDLEPEQEVPSHLVRPLLHVDSSLPLVDLLGRMRGGGVHIAVLTDEGSTVGLVTL